MVTKGEIQTIDYLSNTCQVRIPIFESTTRTNAFIVPATFSIMPGTINMYSPGDVVYVTFENDGITKAIIMGKLYLGVSEEQTNRGSLKVNSLNVKTDLSIPINTKIVSASDSNINPNNAITNYDSISKIINVLSTTKAAVEKLNANNNSPIVNLLTTGKIADNKAIVNTISTDTKQILILTFGNCFTFIPACNLQLGQTYKTAGTFIDTSGGAVTTTVNFKLSDDNTKLQIWSGNSQKAFVNNWTYYVFGIAVQ